MSSRLICFPVDQINVQLERCSLQWAAEGRGASRQKNDQEKGRKD